MINTHKIELHILGKLYSQVRDIIHDGPAFNRMPLGVDEVIVDLREVKYNDTELRTENTLKDKHEQ